MEGVRRRTTVYKNFFGLTDNPFNIVPDPRYLFSTPETDEAFANLIFGVHSHKGLILLTGEVGTGKTILLKKLLDRLRSESAATAFVFNPRLNPTEFFDYVLSDFGVDHDCKDNPRMLRTLYQWLMERHRVSQTSVLIVDEAHDLSAEVFEEIRLLSNLETPTDKLLQIILSGQPEIEEKLMHPELRQFRQRIALRRHTCALSLADTSRYIAQRLRVAGGDAPAIFSPEAMAGVFKFSQGIPRLINLLCEHALISAYADQEKPVGAVTVEGLAAHFKLVTCVLPSDLVSGEPVKDHKPDAVSQPPMETANLPSPPAPLGTQAISPEPGRILRLGEKLASAGTSGQASSAHQPVEIFKHFRPRAWAKIQALAPPSRELAKPAEESVAGGTPPQVPLVRQPWENTRQISPHASTPSHVPTPHPGEISKRPEKHVPATAPTEAAPVVKQDADGRATAPQTPAETRSLPPVLTIPASPLKEARVPARVIKPSVNTAQRPIPVKGVSAFPVPPYTDRPATAKQERPKNLEWAFLVLITMGFVLGGYHALSGNRFMLMKDRQAPSSQSQPVRSVNPPASVPAPAEALKPVGNTGETRQNPAAIQPTKATPSKAASQKKTLSRKAPRRRRLERSTRSTRRKRARPRERKRDSKARTPRNRIKPLVGGQKWLRMRRSSIG